MSNSIMLGYDCLYWQNQGLTIPVYAPLNGHYIVLLSAVAVAERVRQCFIGCTRHVILKPNFT